jgi:hypothetical protein
MREELTEQERYEVAEDVVDAIKEHGDPLRPSEEIKVPSAHST